MLEGLNALLKSVTLPSRPVGLWAGAKCSSCDGRHRPPPFLCDCGLAQNAKAESASPAARGQPPVARHSQGGGAWPGNFVLFSTLRVMRRARQQLLFGLVCSKIMLLRVEDVLDSQASQEWHREIHLSLHRCARSASSLKLILFVDDPKALKS